MGGKLVFHAWCLHRGRLIAEWCTFVHTDKAHSATAASTSLYPVCDEWEKINFPHFYTASFLLEESGPLKVKFGKST